MHLKACAVLIDVLCIPMQDMAYSPCGDYDEVST